MATAQKKPIEKISRKDMANMSYEDIMKVGRVSYGRLITYVKPYKFRFFIGILFAALAGAYNGVLFIGLKIIFSIVLPGSALTNDLAAASSTGAETGIEKKSILDRFTDNAVIYVNQAMERWLPEGAADNRLTVVLVCCGLIPLLLAIRGLITYIGNYCMMWVGNRVLFDLRNECYSGLLRQSQAFYNTSKTGDLMQTVFNQTRMAQTGAMTLVRDFVKHPIAILSMLIVLLLAEPMFTFYALVVFPLCLVPVIIISQKVRKAGGGEEQEAGMMMVGMQETFAGIDVVKGHGREPYEMKKFTRSNRGMMEFMMRWQKAQEIVAPLVETVASFGIAAGLFYAWYNDIPAAQFFLLCLGLMQIYPPAKALSRTQIVLQKCVVATTRVFAIMDRPSDVQDKEDAIELDNPRGHVWFNGVTFSYKKGLPAVKWAKMELHPGKFYALVGPSGGGKSTLLNLLMRFYDPDEGTIEVDGIDIRDLKQDSLRDHIGMVNQDTFLFHDTILDNIRYGRLDATDEECIDAARRAHAHEFILEQDKGYETLVGDQGTNLSGGQKQRISIARAILRNAPILLLDEATSALDTEYEKKIQEAIHQLSEGKTVIAIAHRLSTILEADEIFVIKDAQILETGTHEQLLENSPMYQRLYHAQFKGEADLAEADALGVPVPPTHTNPVSAAKKAANKRAARKKRAAQKKIAAKKAASPAQPPK